MIIDEECFFEAFQIEPIVLDYPDNFEYYPEINSDILLELICILNKYTTAVLDSENVEDLRQEVLKLCIINYREPHINEDGDEFYNEELYEQIRNLFNYERAKIYGQE